MVYLCLKHIWNHTSHLSLNFFFQMSGQCLHDLAASFCYHDKYLHKLCLMQSKYVVPRPVFPLLTMILSLLRDFLLEKNIIAATENHKQSTLTVILPHFFASPSYLATIQYLIPIKSIMCNSRFCFICWTTHNWINADITCCRTSHGIWVNTSEFTGKDNDKIVYCWYFFDLMMVKTYYMSIIVTICTFETSPSSDFNITVFSFRLYIPNTYKESWKQMKQPIGRKCCQLTVLKVLLMCFSH